MLTVATETGWAFVEVTRLRVTSRQSGIIDPVIRNDITRRLVEARQNMGSNLNPKNRRGFALKIAAHQARLVAGRYDRKAVFVAKSDRAKMTADYWRMIATKISTIRSRDVVIE